MAITGIHTPLYTPEAEALRSTLRDVFGWHHVDAGEGWLIFRLPPAEMGVHPGDAPAHQVSIMCDDLHATIAELTVKGIGFVGEPVDEGFGIVTQIVLPGGVEMQLYEPGHPTAI
jgi:predicted enzyme related to lactoylglutathione lyase